jgi:hypothetical protein
MYGHNLERVHVLLGDLPVDLFQRYGQQLRVTKDADPEWGFQKDAGMLSETSDHDPEGYHALLGGLYLLLLQAAGRSRGMTIKDQNRGSRC